MSGSSRSLLRGLTATALVAAFAVLAPAAGAATIGPIYDLDQSINDNNCSVREAITSANTNSNAHEDACAAGDPAPGVDVIDLDGTGYELLGNGDDTNTTGDFDVDPAGGPLIVDGEALDGSPDTNIDADGVDRIFHVLGDGATNPVTIRDTFLLGGKVTNAQGGTILLGNADLTLDNVIVAFAEIDGTITTAMRGAGVATTFGELTVLDSSFRENVIDASGAGAGTAQGAGIYLGTAATATIDRSSISEGTIVGNGVGVGGNQTFRGGGVATENADEDVTIKNSLIYSNAVSGGDFQQGAGIDWDEDETANVDVLRLTNVTFSANDVGAGNGGGLYANGDAILSHTTFGPNTAMVADGLFVNNGPVQIRNSLFETGTPSDADCGGPDDPVSLGYNIERGTSEECDFSEPTDQLPDQPLMSPLDENGGPWKTHQISLGFINSVPLGSCSDGSTALTRDARNAPRPGEGTAAACDPGAYERNFCETGIDVKIIGTEGNDQLTGTAAADGIMGMGGNDTIDPGDGADGVCGGEGDDVLLEHLQDGDPDVFRGDTGSDTLDFSQFLNPVTLDLAVATQTAGTGLGSTSQTMMENVIGGLDPDTLLGNAGPNRLDGFLDNDPMINGRGGSDTLLGNIGNDSLFARDGVFDLVDCGVGTGDTAQTDQLSLDSVSGCESVDALPEPPVVTPTTPAATPAPAPVKKKCKKKKRKGASAAKKCRRKK